jgi:hypothetical protein
MAHYSDFQALEDKLFNRQLKIKISMKKESRLNPNKWYVTLYRFDGDKISVHTSEYLEHAIKGALLDYDKTYNFGGQR